MAWTRPTIEELKLVLAQDEIDKLDSYSSDITDRIQKQLDMVADEFRAAFRSKGYQIDTRDHYIDEGYLVPMLNYARWQIWSTFPMADNYALSEPRKKQYEEAAALLKNPYLGTSIPDNGEPTPEPTDPDDKLAQDPAITIPWLKFPPSYENGGFPEVYWKTHKIDIW